MSKYLTRFEAVNHALKFDNSDLDNFPFFTWQDVDGWHCIDFSQIDFVSRFPDDILVWFRSISKKDFRKVVHILRAVMKLQHSCSFHSAVPAVPDLSSDELPF